MITLTMTNKTNYLKMQKTFFQEMSANEEQSKSNTIKEILHLLSNEKSITKTG